MNGLRTFSPDVEAIAAAWHDEPQTNENWANLLEPGPDPGVLGGYIARSGALEGFCKPTNVQGPSPFAAHEKIASDLGYMLGLPIPPVTLRDAGEGAASRYQSISLISFKPVFKWKQVALIPHQATRFLGVLGKAASAMVAFDTWIDNHDRVNDGNLVVGESGGTLNYAYIDFSYSMSHGWKNGMIPSGLRLTDIYPTQVMLDIECLDSAVAAIEGLSDDQIKGTVAKIPLGFINDQQRQAITDGLIVRRGSLRAGIKSKYRIT